MTKIFMLLALISLVSCNSSGDGEPTPSSVDHDSIGVVPVMEPLEETVYWATIDPLDERKQVGGRVELDCNSKKCALDVAVVRFDGPDHTRSHSFKGEIDLSYGPLNGHYQASMIYTNSNGTLGVEFSIILNDRLEPVMIKGESFCMVYNHLSFESNDYFEMVTGKIGISDHPRTFLTHYAAMRNSSSDCTL